MSEYNIQMNKYNALNANYDQLYPQPMKHASTHAKNGSDPILPSSIGAYSKEETDTLLQKKVNPNLLDNWYFLNPINQRGVTSGTAGWNEYFLDRWQGACSYDITKGYLEVGNDSYIVQRIENGGSIPYPVTFSILFQDGTFGYQTVYADGGFSLIGENIKGYADCQIHKEAPYITYANNSGSSVGIIAVKLELGTTQTLAHQDSSGNWVLNEIPNYGEQLRRCRRYFRKSIWSVVTRNSGTYWPVAYDATDMRTITSCTIEKLCYIGHSNIDPGESSVMSAESKFGSIMLYANLPTMDSNYPEATSCGIIFTLSADL